jgi:hypothetical protein
MDVSLSLYREDETDSMNDEDREEEPQIPEKLQLPIVYPRQKYTGTCNVETVKDGENLSR